MRLLLKVLDPFRRAELAVPSPGWLCNPSLLGEARLS